MMTGLWKPFPTYYVLRLRAKISRAVVQGLDAFCDRRGGDQ